MISGALKNKRAFAALFLLALFLFCAIFACTAEGGGEMAGMAADPTPEPPTPQPILVSLGDPVPADTAVPAPTLPPTPTPEPTPTPVPTLDPNGKYIALTFDDGPNGKAGYTKDLLAVLRKYEVKVTFFVVGYKLETERNMEALREAAADGHEIGNHTYDHANLSKYSDEGIRKQMARTNDAIEKIIGYRPTLFRPPYGESNQTVRAFAKSNGMAVIMWDLSTHDWYHEDAGKTFAAVKKDAHPGSIILMHDSVKSSAEAVEKIIQWLHGEGYTIITVGELLRLRHGEIKPGTQYRHGVPAG
ncbi:MAG: polysaccharide deacetylase family protein [Clostridiales bacterium]|nr:polysaccharide deacetylase family protein [Clostridiales bacterium]